jgi:hypothetical protein
MKRHRGSARRGLGERAAADPDDPGAAAARARVAALFERSARAELQVVVVAPPDAMRLAARERARAAAIASGRGDLLDDAIAAAREATIRSFARGGFSGTWAATDMAVSVVRASDRVFAAAALEEAATAAVGEDLVDADTLEILRSTFDELEGLRGIPPPGSLSALTMPPAGAIRGPLQRTIFATFVILCVLIALAIHVAFGLGLLAAGVAILAGLARRRPEPGP